MSLVRAEAGDGAHGNAVRIKPLPRVASLRGPGGVAEAVAKRDSVNTAATATTDNTAAAAASPLPRNRGKEVFDRDRVQLAERERARREKEEKAKRAREQAAERGRVASREWAEKMRARREGKGGGVGEKTAAGAGAGA